MTSHNRLASATRLRERRKQRELGQTEFHRVLDHLPSSLRPYFVTLAVTGLRIDQLCELQPECLDHEQRAIRVADSKAPIGLRTVYVAEEFWSWVLAAFAVPITQPHLRDHWNGAVERAGLRKVSVSQIQRLRSKLLVQAKEGPMIRLLGDEVREDALFIRHLFPALALTEDEGRRLLVRVV